MLKKLWNMGRCSYYKNTVYITAIDHHNTCISTCITCTHFYQLYQCPYALSQYRCKECILKKLSQKSHTGFLTISKGLTTLQEAPVFSMTQIEWGWGGGIPSHNGRSTSCPPNQHVADEWPAITIDVVHLGTAQSVGAVEASNEINLPIIHSDSWPCSWLVHGPQGCPLVCNSIVPDKEL